MEKITQSLIVCVVTITIVAALTFVDSQTPVATAKFKISDSVYIRISAYDSENGFFKSFIDKLKVLLENLKTAR